MSRSRFVQGACLFVWVLGAVGIVSASQEKNSLLPPQENLTQLAKDLEVQGNWPQAFAVYLKFPGGERCAALIAKDDPKTYLAALDTIEAEANHPPNPRLWLVRGDLLIQLGKNAEALACYRKFVAAIGQTPDQTWETGHVPWFYYPVSPQPLGFSYSNGIYPRFPFSEGCGSQVDNWLIQRFLTLNAWQDAGEEFERVWKLHQAAVSEPQFFSDSEAEHQHLWSGNPLPVSENQLYSLSLQFALEYAFFQKKMNQPRKGLDLLLTVFLQLDLEQNPNTFSHSSGFEQQPFEYLKSPYYGYTPIEFIRLAYGHFQTRNQIAGLKKALQHKIKTGRNQSRWVLARVLQLEGKEDEALTTELEYLQRSGFNQQTVAFRSGLVFERYNRPQEAVTAFEKCLKLPRQPLRFPAPDNHELRRRMMRNMITIEYGYLFSPSGRVFKHLFEAYCALGETEKALQTGLRRLEYEASLEASRKRREETSKLIEFERIERMKPEEFHQLQMLFTLSGREAELKEWLQLHQNEFSRNLLLPLENHGFALNQEKPRNIPNIPGINPDSSMVSGTLQTRDSETISLKGVERPSIHQRIRFNHRSFGQSFFSQRQVTGEKKRSSTSPSPVQNPCGSPITADALRQLINKPPVVSRDFNNDRIAYNSCLQALGAALLTNPELVQLLLESQPDTVDQFEHYRNLVKGIFSHADRRLLAKVHQALTSPNMIIRRNAAYACAGFGDQASIPLLIQALKTESSLVRKGVIWSLGELKARQAVPAIMKLLLEAHHPLSRTGHTFRTDEMNRALERQYRELKTNTPPLAQPEADYYPQSGQTRVLLGDFDYTNALIAIGPEFAQAYFRFEVWNPGIASYRKFAPTYLAECLPTEKVQNREILRSLAAKDSAEAAVSLLILGDTAIEAAILNWLNNRHPRLTGQLIKELVRVKDKSKLAFARSTLTQIAQDESVYSNMRQAAKALIKE